MSQKSFPSIRARLRSLVRDRRTSTSLRVACVVSLMLGLTLLAAGHPAWAGPLLAQTVPTVTKSPTVGPPPATASATPAPTETPAATGTPAGPTSTPRPTLPPARPSAAAPAASPTLPPGCGVAPRGATALRPGARFSLRLGATRFTLQVTQRPATGAPCWLTVEAVSPAGLPALPSPALALTRSLRLAGVGPDGQPAVTATRGLLGCFQLPQRVAAGVQLRLGLLGLPAAPQVWRVIPAQRLGDQICAPLPTLPITVVLIAQTP